jgi:serine/threonine protein kinase
VKLLVVMMMSESLNVCVFAGNFLISNRGEVKVGDFGILRDMNEPGRARALSSMTEEKEAPESASLNNSINNNGNANGGGDGTSGVVVPAPADVNTLITSPLQRAHTFVGTATYMSPERIDGREYSYPSDIWAFGLSLLAVALGKMPIDTKGGYWGILQRIRDGEPPSVPANSSFSDDFKDFIAKSLRTNPDERWNCAQLLKHPFLSKAGKDDDPNADAEAEKAGMDELRTILSAMHLHLDNMSIGLCNRPKPAPSETETPSKSESVDFAGFFGDLGSPDAKVVDAMRRIIFGNYSDADCGGGGSVDVDVAAIRLQTLANQLNLSVSRLVQEIELLLYEIDINGSLENLVTTPRTARR